jgi:serine/threonine-protein kinase RsbW
VQAHGTFRGRLSGFGEVRALAEAFAAAAGADRGAALRLVLILEELFTNTVTHGYPPGAEGPIWVAFASRADTIEVTYEDEGPAFDPLADAPGLPGDFREDAGDLSGGLGLALVRGLSAAARYARVGDRNRITLAVPTHTSPSPGAGP